MNKKTADKSSPHLGHMAIRNILQSLALFIRADSSNNQVINQSADEKTCKVRATVIGERPKHKDKTLYLALPTRKGN